MRKFLGIATAGALALFAHAANADEVTGAISNIDMTAATFEVDGKIFTADPNNTVGTKLGDLQDGDNVRVEFATADAESGETPINAMVLEKQ